MLKRFFTAVILAVFMLSAQIAKAEYWNEYEEIVYSFISTKTELFNLFENQRRWGYTKIHVIFTDGFKLDQLRDSDGKGFNDLANHLIMASFRVTIDDYDDDGNELVTFTITEYPGTRVANAYLHDNKDDLTMDEVQLYNKAVEIVNEANKCTSVIAKELYIHDQICKLTTYEQDKNTAISALVYGKADCDGYADTFYMLGRMCGFNVGRINGVANGGAHAWNTITFEDGETYFVDVTWDDQLNSHTWFNAPLEVMQKTHSCDWKMIFNLQ